MRIDLRKEDHFDLWRLENIDAQYGALVSDIIAHGTDEHDADRSEDSWRMLLNCMHLLHNTALSFPALLCKSTNIGTAIKEICWMANGSTNVKDLDSKIWNEWAGFDGSIGWGYGRMMRALPDEKVLYTQNVEGTNFTEAEIARQTDEITRCRDAGYRDRMIQQGEFLLRGTIDQMLNSLLMIKARSRSRRNIVRTFNPAFLPLQNLPPCHTDMTFNVTKARDYEQHQMEQRGDDVSSDSLHISVQLRSSDTCLGRPFNVAQYSALHHLFAVHAGLNIGSFCLKSDNTHIYTHHLEDAKQIPQRVDTMIKEAIEANKVPTYPTLFVDPEVKAMDSKALLDNMCLDMFRWTDYNPQPHIPFRVTT